MDPNLAKRARFFLEHAGYSTSPGRVACALSLARAEARAKELGLSVVWEDDDLPWDADLPAPAILQTATVFAPGVDPSSIDARFPFFEGRTAPPGYAPRGPGNWRKREVLASLGGIGLESWRDPYVQVVEAELLSEALDELDAERDAQACVQAAELSSRATYAGPCHAE